MANGFEVRFERVDLLMTPVAKESLGRPPRVEQHGVQIPFEFKRSSGVEPTTLMIAIEGLQRAPPPAIRNVAGPAAGHETA